MIKTVFKTGMDIEQILAKNAIPDVDGYEIQMRNSESGMHLISLLDKKLYAIHTPFDKCDLSQWMNREGDTFFDDLMSICKKEKCGLVIHDDLSFGDYITHPKRRDFESFLAKYNVPIHLENCTTYELSFLEVPSIANYINAQLEKDIVYPLLDVCHYLILANDIEFDGPNLSKTLEIFNSEKVYIHLCDIVGSGKRNLGGLHGTNFHYNSRLLYQILDKLEELHPNKDVILVLEVGEENYNTPMSAIELNMRIKQYLNKKHNQSR